MLYICVLLSVYRLYRFYLFMKLHKLEYHPTSEKELSENNDKEKELVSIKGKSNDKQSRDKEKPEGEKSAKALKNYENDYY
jgi:hypothetical protein